MTRSELITRLAARADHLPAKDVVDAATMILSAVTQALVDGGRVEIRGFGSFDIHQRPPRTGRNPKTGESVEVPVRHLPHFKPGRELRERVNASHRAD
jgi:integration host factor subunit beta